MKLMAWLKKLFAPVGEIPPAVNRKERRMRASIARRTRMHKLKPDEPTDNGS